MGWFLSVHGRLSACMRVSLSHAFFISKGLAQARDMTEYGACFEDLDLIHSLGTAGYTNTVLWICSNLNVEFRLFVSQGWLSSCS